jgi:hypothetical protein
MEAHEAHQHYQLRKKPSEEVAEHGGGFIVGPLEGMGEVIFSGTGEAIGEAHLVADQTVARFGEWFEGPHRGALGVEGLEFVAMRAQKLKLEFGGSGIVRGAAGHGANAVTRAVHAWPLGVAYFT